LNFDHRNQSALNTNPLILAIIQARTAASRLPGKVLRDIAGEPMLVRVLKRTQRASTVEEVLVATTDEPADDAIQELCSQRGYACFRGSNYDVLDRYYRAAQDYHADYIVRVTADCPVIDPSVIDKTVLALFGSSDVNHLGEPVYDFAANRLPPPWKRTYPVGLDTEVCSFQNLELAWKEADQTHQREHVMPFFYEQPQRFRICHVTHDPDYGAQRWTVDTPQDLELLRMIYNRFSSRDDFSWLEIIDLLNREPEIARINAHVQAKHYRQVDSRSS